MEAEVIYKVNKQELKEAMSETITSEIEEKVYNRFSNRLISSKTACEILGLSHSTLLTYVKEGRITPVNETERYHKFDLADVLRADIKKFSRVANLRLKRKS